MNIRARIFPFSHTFDPIYRVSSPRDTPRYITSNFYILPSARLLSCNIYSGINELFGRDTNGDYERCWTIFFFFFFCANRLPGQRCIFQPTRGNFYNYTGYLRFTSATAQYTRFRWVGVCYKSFRDGGVMYFFIPGARCEFVFLWNNLRLLFGFIRAVRMPVKSRFMVATPL